LELIPTTSIDIVDTCRLIPSRYPPVGVLDQVASPEDLDLMFELESWTNDRISAELGLLYRLPPSEWVVGRPMASVIMAAFCHPSVNGSRFTGPDRGAWYAGLDLETAHAEVIYRRTQELAEVGVFETRVQVRLYLADFQAEFHDIRRDCEEFALYHHPTSYEASQDLGRRLLEAGSNGILYRSVRRAGGTCIVCFRPRLVSNVRPSAHFEYRWEGTKTPKIRRLRETVR
jgi:RES domain.